MPKDKKDRKLVLIDWIDSVHDSGWQRISHYEPSEEQMIHRTVGWIVHESKTALAVCQSYGLNREDPTIDAIMQIPRVAITKLTVLKPPRR